jgi:hypothetical protein
MIEDLVQVRLEHLVGLVDRGQLAAAPRKLLRAEVLLDMGGDARAAGGLVDGLDGDWFHRSLRRAGGGRRTLFPRRLGRRGLTAPLFGGAAQKLADLVVQFLSPGVDSRRPRPRPLGGLRDFLTLSRRVEHLANHPNEEENDGDQRAPIEVGQERGETDHACDLCTIRVLVLLPPAMAVRMSVSAWTLRSL